MDTQYENNVNCDINNIKCEEERSKSRKFLYAIKGVISLKYDFINIFYVSIMVTTKEKSAVGMQMIMIKSQRASRWWRSKMWRSPSSPQIHQKYIYMWNNSYRTPTEPWQKTSYFPKAKKLPHIPG